VLVDPQAARGPWPDDATVEQDANHLAAEQAGKLDPGLPWRPWLCDSIEIVHRQARVRHKTEVCGSRLWARGLLFDQGRVPTSSR
jgi:hypothetical protein